jgi:hypothetical protein
MVPLGFMEECRRKGAKEEEKHDAFLTTVLLAPVFGTLPGKLVGAVYLKRVSGNREW